MVVARQIVEENLYPPIRQRVRPLKNGDPRGSAARAIRTTAQKTLPGAAHGAPDCELSGIFTGWHFRLSLSCQAHLFPEDWQID